MASADMVGLPRLVVPDFGLVVHGVDVAVCRVGVVVPDFGLVVHGFDVAVCRVGVVVPDFGLVVHGVDVAVCRVGVVVPDFGLVVHGVELAESAAMPWCRGAVVPWCLASTHLTVQKYETNVQDKIFRRMLQTWVTGRSCSTGRCSACSRRGTRPRPRGTSPVRRA
ncbi:hypothetical protein ACQP1P_09365 [Dactylosporangium sp. CA-052675]|uniref:hypothetical protein n=1 Tax=Dactylosporangium sp. CA-052675 TaxID=3239927 RepID=UPI003D8BA2D3